MIYKYISQLSNMQRRLIDRLAKDKDYSGTEGKLIHYLFENRDKTVYQKNIDNQMEHQMYMKLNNKKI